jgi:hypothetical protein
LEFGFAGSPAIAEAGQWRRLMYRVARIYAAPLAALILVLSSQVSAAAVEAYIFRGAGDFSFIQKNLTFSDGMDRLGEKLAEAGRHATVYRWQSGEFAYREIMRRKPEAVALMGHSMGALAAITLAGRLKESGIRVAYLGLIDIPGPASVAPANVELAENFYHAFPVYGRLSKSPGSATVVRNEMVWGQVHVTMDNSAEIHAAMLAGVEQFRPEETPSAKDGETVMQSYLAASPERPERERVGRLMTGSVSNAASAHDGLISTADGDAVAGAAVSAVFAAQMPSLHIPVPTRRPRLYDTASGLPPIE